MQWHKRTSVFQDSRIAIDPLADWDIGAVHTRSRLLSGRTAGISDTENLSVAVLIRLREGTAASGLQRYIDSPASGVQFQALVLPAYTDAKAAWATARYCTARVTKAFMEALPTHAGLGARIESVTLSIEPRPIDTNARIAGAGRGRPRAEDGAVIMGLIDHGIPLAHANLRDASGRRTQLLAAWLQDTAPVSLGNGQTTLVPSDFLYGVDFVQQDINRLLSRTQDDEPAFYRISGMFKPDSRETYWTQQHVTHGSAVLGLLTDTSGKPAAHADARPLVCVQLPEKTVADGSGHSLAVNVIDGLRFIAGVAEDSVRSSGSPVAPVVVTLSYGNSAGSHDGKSDLELAIENIVDLWTEQHPQSPFIIVVPAGNSFQMQGHAVWRQEDVVTRDPAKGTLTWDILPDDATASIVQIWLPDSMVNPRLTVETPAGSKVILDTASSNLAELRHDEGTVALAQALYCTPKGNRSKRLFQVVVGPTVDPDYGSRNAPSTSPVSGHVIAPAGFWQLHLAADAMSETDEVHAWIERDDRPLRSGRQGRQSRFSHVDYQPVLPPGQPGDGTREKGLVRRPGSMNGLASGYGTIVVGVAFASDGIASRLGETAPYSGGSASGTGGQPVDFTVNSDQSAVMLGQRTAGVTSGSVARLHGTSMAAPLAARSIADHIDMFRQSHAKVAVTSFMLMAGGTLRRPENNTLQGANQDRDGIGFLAQP